MPIHDIGLMVRTGAQRCPWYASRRAREHHARVGRGRRARARVFLARARADERTRAMSSPDAPDARVGACAVKRPRDDDSNRAAARRAFIDPRARTAAAPPPRARTATTRPRMCFTALYCKIKPGGGGKQRSAKKFQDGVARVDETGACEVIDVRGNRVARGHGGTIVSGTTTQIGVYEVEIGESVPEEEVMSGAVFSRGGAAAAPRPAAAAPRPAIGRFVAPMRSGASASASASASVAVRSEPAFEEPLYSDVAENALVLSTRETDFHRRDARTSCAVVCDPFVARFLRPHQREGVRFMYECVMGLRESVHTNQAHTGCLLAHEMGLGKTLQVIALVWTLLKQSPFKRGQPTIRRAVICVPASLVGNWAAEFKKWLGDERCEPKVVEGGDKEARRSCEDFALASQRRYHVLITSYETLRAQSDVLSRANIDLLVCDEAHRLKNATQSTKGAQALASLRCHRRVLLTGTPIQNDLEELWAVMDFACPGLMGDLTSFRQIYALPIEKAGERGAKHDVVRIGNARRDEVSKLIDPFIHCRKADEINASLLPPKTEYVVFVRLSEAQEKLYVDQLKQKSVQSLLGRVGKTSDVEAISPLAAIQTLQKLCNAAALAVETTEVFETSSKLSVLRTMFRALPSDERIVIVSGFTTTLDLIATLCESEQLKYDRLQGSTPPKDRTAIVRKFNTSGRILLLSTKAGGVGLNLVGANRLVLVDSSWNPAHDLQAQARIWREGQTKPCTIYRLLSTGTIEERMFQRQELKGALARQLGFKATSANAGGSSSSSTFTQAELRDLFSYVKNTSCDTADRIKAQPGETPKHWCVNAATITTDTVLLNAMQGDAISFVAELPSVESDTTIASVEDARDENEDGTDEDE